MTTSATCYRNSNFVSKSISEGQKSMKISLSYQITICVLICRQCALHKYDKCSKYSKKYSKINTSSHRWITSILYSSNLACSINGSISLVSYYQRHITGIKMCPFMPFTYDHQRSNHVFPGPDVESCGVLIRYLKSIQ